MSDIFENDMINCAVGAIQEKMGYDVKAMFVGEVTAITDFFVLASCSNTTQLGALVDGVEESMKDSGYVLKHREGKTLGGWILLDYSDIVIHLFLSEMREFYDLDHSWRDVKTKSYD